MTLNHQDESNQPPAPSANIALKKNTVPKNVINIPINPNSMFNGSGLIQWKLGIKKFNTVNKPNDPMIK